jgi:3-hydroxyisobutyrate dehydrogenase
MNHRAEPGKTKIGWIGTGVMGKSMAGHLLSAGYQVTLYSRTREKSEDLLARGAQWGATPLEVAKASDIIFTMVGYPHDVREVTLGTEGTLAGSKAGNILVDMTTSEPSLAVEIARIAAGKGIGSVDAPVSGGDIGARNAALSIMIGGDAKDVDAVLPCFEVMGKTIKHQGPAGSGQHTKMVNQLLIGPMMIAVCEALLYAQKAGLDPLKVIESVGSGAAGSWSINNLGPRIIKRDFEPGFYVEHFIKDMGIALAEAKRMGLALPGLGMAEQLYLAVQAQGYGRKGTQALMLALEQMSGIHQPPTT